MLADVPRERRKCYGRQPWAPCPAHDDGTWPEGCDCIQSKSSMNGYDRDLLVPIAVTLLFATAVVCLILWLMFSGAAKAANDTPYCLTQEQARAKWPKQYLYWHTKDHCWDNVRAYATPDRRAKGGKIRRTPVLDANGNELTPMSASEIDNIQYRQEAEKRLQTCCWPVEPSFAPWQSRINGNF